MFFKENLEIMTEETPPIQQSIVFKAFAILFAAGVFLDFLFVGVLKLIWPAIYGAIYIGICAWLFHEASIRKWRPHALKMIGILMCGVVFAHLLARRSEIRTYPMNWVGDPGTIELQSPEFSDTLFVTSDAVQNTLSKLNVHTGIPLVIQVVKNYGCIESFKASSIAGVDVMNDPKAIWVWKSAPGATVAGQAGMKEENSRLFWCQIQWF